MNTDKVSKLEEEQLDNVQGGFAISALVLTLAPIIATAFGCGACAVAKHIADKRDAEAAKASKKR